MAADDQAMKIGILRPEMIALAMAMAMISGCQAREYDQIKAKLPAGCQAFSRLVTAKNAQYASIGEDRYIIIGQDFYRPVFENYSIINSDLSKIDEKTLYIKITGFIGSGADCGKFSPEKLFFVVKMEERN
jgi:hypothetical protein